MTKTDILDFMNWSKLTFSTSEIGPNEPFLESKIHQKSTFWIIKLAKIEFTCSIFKINQKWRFSSSEISQNLPF